MKYFFGILSASIVALIIGCAAKEMEPKHMDVKQQNPVLLAPSAFYEACEPLSPGRQVEFFFKTSSPVDFTVYYHTMEGLRYPVKKDHVTSFRGRFTAEAKATYCFVWTNRQPGPASLTYDFNIVGK